MNETGIRAGIRTGVEQLTNGTVDKRKNWDQYFLSIAKEVAARSTCARLSVGAVIVRDKKILSTGYNGSPRHAVHCIDKGCLMVDGHCKRVIHAEVNAIICSDVSIKYSVIYVTHNPCISCFALLYQAGIRRIVYDELYKSVDYQSLGINDNCMPDVVQINTGATSS